MPVTEVRSRRSEAGETRESFELFVLSLTPHTRHPTPCLPAGQEEKHLAYDSVLILDLGSFPVVVQTPSEMVTRLFNT